MAEIDRLRIERDFFKNLSERQAKDKARLIRKCDEHFGEIERLHKALFEASDTGLREAVDANAWRKAVHIYRGSFNRAKTRPYDDDLKTVQAIVAALASTSDEGGEK